MLIDGLPRLTHLDISGTNLAGTGVAQCGTVLPLASSNNVNINNNQPFHNSFVSRKLAAFEGNEENNYSTTYRSISDIPGLSKRMHKPLEFLGLYGTLHSACQRHDIPAKVVSNLLH